MAKRKTNQGETTKSDAVREMLTNNPKTPVKEIVSGLDQRGIKVSPNWVYFVKSKMKRKTRREKRQRAVEASREAGFASPVELILEVRRLAEKAGGMRHLKELVDLLAE